MKILITGGCGFIGSHVADRFNKEGYRIYIIDNLSTGSLENINIPHKFYNMNVADKKCEDLFRANKFDIVIHLSAQVDVTTSIEHPYLDTKSNLLGLTNILDLSSKYGVKRFIFASSAAVYGNVDTIPITEETKNKPISPYGMSKYVGEFYCEKWKEIYNLDTFCFRFSNVFGPRQGLKGESGVISIFMEKLIKNETITIYGDGTQTRDFIYVEDLADAIFKASQLQSFDILNLSTNTETSLNRLVEILSTLQKPKEVVYKKMRSGDILHSRLDNTKAKAQLNWAPMYTFEDGLTKTYKWYIKNHKRLFPLEKKSSLPLYKFKNTALALLPYWENILLFSMFTFASYKIPYLYTSFFIGSLDLNIVYIAIMATFYGMKQASLAILFSSIFYILLFLNLGKDIITLFYDPQYGIHLLFYLLIGNIIGYAIDRKNRKIFSQNAKFDNFQEKYDFLSVIYEETRLIKEEYQDQIINSEDSFGKIYSITCELDSLEVEDIFTGAIQVLEKIMKSDKISIYETTGNLSYLRLKAKSKASFPGFTNSIRVDDFIEFKEVISSKNIFINRKLTPNIPIMICPIIIEDVVVALVFLHELNFENVTLYYENLFKISVNLISNSLGKASKYEKAREQERYVEGTRILKPVFFKEIVEKKQNNKEKSNLKFSLIKIEITNEAIQTLSHKLFNIIRITDYIGFGEDGNLYILLANTSSVEARNVLNRLLNDNFIAHIVSNEFTD